jgi:uncharacterized protein YjbI with pentapeptide repeats
MSQLKTMIIIMLMLTSVLAGCTGDSEVIDDTAREDIQDITTSNTENQNNMAANISIISSSLEALSTDLSGLNNDLIVKETSLLSTISIAEARMSSLEAHNLFLQVTLAGMNDSNSVEAQSLQDQILDSNAEITSMVSTLESTYNDLATVQSALSALDNAVASLESTLSSVQEGIDQNILDIDKNSDDILGLSEDVLQLSEQITILAEELNSLIGTANGMNNNLAAELYEELTHSEQYDFDFDGDGIIDFVFSLTYAIFDCTEISFEDLSNIDFSEASMASTDFRYVDLSYSNLSNVFADPTGCSGGFDANWNETSVFNGVLFDRTMFIHVNMTYTLLNEIEAPSVFIGFSILDNADFSSANLSATNSSWLTFVESLLDVTDQNENGSIFIMNSAIGTVFEGGIMDSIQASQNNFTLASFIDANLDNSFLEFNDFTDADFSGASLENVTGVQNYWDGVNFSNANLNNSSFDFSSSSGITWYYTTCPDGTSSGATGSC